MADVGEPSTTSGQPPPLKGRSGSLPPSALPRPPRSLKPPRKIDYDRLSDTSSDTIKQPPSPTTSKLPQQHHHQPPSSPTTSTSSTVTTGSNTSTSQLQPPKSTSASLKRGEFQSTTRREYSQPKTTGQYNMADIKDALTFPKPDFSLKRKDYGAMNKTEFCKPDYTTTKNYHRLEDPPSKSKTATPPSSEQTFKRSLLPSARSKYSPSPQMVVKSSRDSLNSSESNNSTNSRASPAATTTTTAHMKCDSNLSAQQQQQQQQQYHQQQQHSRTPPKYVPMNSQFQEKSLMVTRQLNNQRQQHLHLQQQLQAASLMPTGLSAAGMSPVSSGPVASLPPKQPMENKARRGGSLTRGENRYRIQF